MTEPDAAAIVIVRKPGIDVEMLVDSSNVGQILPDEQTFEQVRRHFARHGFEPTAGFAGTFTITGPRELFAQLLPAMNPVHGDELPSESDPGNNDAPAAAPTEVTSETLLSTWLAPVAEHIAAITHCEPVETDFDT